MASESMWVSDRDMPAECARLATERDNWQQRAEVVEQAMQGMAAEIQGLTAERDAAEQKHKKAAEWNSQLAIHLTDMRAERDAARAEVAIVIEERDAWKQRADALAKALESAAQRVTVEMQRLTDERDVARAECEGLRADLLAHPPEPHRELAIERERHAELMEDYDRREVVITTLEETLRRAENALKTAQVKHIDERLKGFLAVISQLADQAQDLL